METMSSLEASHRYPAERKAPPRRALGAILVACLYTLLCIGAPLLVRYGPEADVGSEVARILAGS
jgi:hypothetical protein